MTFRFLPRRLRRRREELDARVDEARQRAATAEVEVHRSRERQREVRQTVVIPLRQAETHNQFADKIRMLIVERDGR